MGKLCFVILALSGLSARADPLGEVCGQLIGTKVTQCMAASKGRFVSSAAAEQCGKLIGTKVIDCVSAIAGKDYSGGEVNTCGELIGAQVVDCFRRTGRAHAVQGPPPRGGPLSYSDVRAEVAAAVEQLQGNDPRGAEVRLRRLLNDMH